jgi:S-adenosyl methyltransferase
MSSPRRLVVISGARRPFCGAEAGSADASSPALAAQGNSGLPPPEFNTGVAHPARVYDYWLGGKDNYAADRALGDTIIEAMPSTQFAARTSSAFLGRAVRYLAAEAGIRQFSISAPTSRQRATPTRSPWAAAPASRIVYVDNDRWKSGCAHDRSECSVNHGRCAPANASASTHPHRHGARASADDQQSGRCHCLHPGRAACGTAILGWLVGTVLVARGLLLEVVLLSAAGGVASSVGPLETHWSLILWNPWFVAGGLLLLLAACQFQRA